MDRSCIVKQCCDMPLDTVAGNPELMDIVKRIQILRDMIAVIDKMPDLLEVFDAVGFDSEMDKCHTTIDAPPSGDVDLNITQNWRMELLDYMVWTIPTPDIITRLQTYAELAPFLTLLHAYQTPLVASIVHRLLTEHTGRSGEPPGPSEIVTNAPDKQPASSQHSMAPCASGIHSRQPPVGCGDKLRAVVHSLLSRIPFRKPVKVMYVRAPTPSRVCKHFRQTLVDLGCTVEEWYTPRYRAMSFVQQMTEMFDYLDHSDVFVLDITDYTDPVDHHRDRVNGKLVHLWVMALTLRLPCYIIDRALDKRGGYHPALAYGCSATINTNIKGRKTVVLTMYSDELISAILTRRFNVL